MAKSSLTLSLRSQPASLGQLSPPQSSKEGAAATASQATPVEAVEAPAEVGLEIKSILARSCSGSLSWEKSSFFGVSPPTRPTDGLVRDRVFGRCIPIAPKPEALSPSGPAISTA